MNIKNQTENNETEEESSIYEHIKDTGSVTTCCGKHKIHCLTILWPWKARKLTYMVWLIAII